MIVERERERESYFLMDKEASKVGAVFVIREDKLRRKISLSFWYFDTG